MFEVGAVRQGKARKLARISVTLGVILIFSSFGMVLTSAAPPDPCQDVWEGVTQSEPLVKIADPATAFPGDEVTYTFQWHSTGAPEASLEDCYRVDDGSNSSLNDLVSGFYHNVDIVNQGDNGDLQTYEYTITIPDDDSLIGHKVVNRAKMTKGSVESRTALVEVTIADPCTENCGGGTGGSTGETTTGETTTGETTTGETTTGETTTGETTTGETTTGGAENGTTTGVQADEVLGRTITRKPLAETGSETIILAWLGLSMLMAGTMLRKYGTRVAVATASPADELVAKSLALIERMVRPGSRDWNCR